MLCVVCMILCVSCKNGLGDDLLYEYDEQADMFASRCKHQSLCEDDLCLYYQQVWKELFMEGHGLSEDYFDRHIEVCGMNFQTLYGATQFHLHYKIKVDWAVTFQIDWMVVKYDEDKVPGGEFLTKDEIKMNQIYKIWIFLFQISEFGYKLPAYESLKFSTYGDAMNYLEKQAKLKGLNFSHINIDPHRKAWILYTLTEYDQESHKCIRAELNLNTGETVIKRESCIID